MVWWLLCDLGFWLVLCLRLGGGFLWLLLFGFVNVWLSVFVCMVGGLFVACVVFCVLF